MVKLDDRSRIEAEQIIRNEISAITSNPSIIRDNNNNGCAPCHVLFKVKETMNVSEQDAADLLSEVLLDNIPLNDQFISIVEQIHMKARMMGVTFAIKTREAKDRYIDANFKNTLSELMSDASVYGTELLVRRLILSHIALNIAQNLGIDYRSDGRALLLHEKERYGYSWRIDAGDTVFIDQKERRKALMTGDIPIKPVWIMEENIFTKIVYRFTLKFTRVGIVEMLEIFHDCIWER